MSPVYDLSQPDDRLRLALSFPTRRHRIEFVGRIREQFGEKVADELKEGLKAYAKQNDMAAD